MQYSHSTPQLSGRNQEQPKVCLIAPSINIINIKIQNKPNINIGAYKPTSNQVNGSNTNAPVCFTAGFKANQTLNSFSKNHNMPRISTKTTQIVQTGATSTKMSKMASNTNLLNTRSKGGISSSHGLSNQNVKNTDNLRPSNVKNSAINRNRSRFYSDADKNSRIMNMKDELNEKSPYIPDPKNDKFRLEDQMVRKTPEKIGNQQITGNLNSADFKKPNQSLSNVP